tara:strand:- start:2265 stop:2750 length:486 start_codon:yes stop_codon:yes gene_type:complete
MIAVSAAGSFTMATWSAGKDLAVGVGEDEHVFLAEHRVCEDLLRGDRRRGVTDLEDGCGSRCVIGIGQLSLLGADHEHLACGMDVLDEKRLGGADELISVFSGSDSGNEESAPERECSSGCSSAPSDASIDGHERRIPFHDGTGRCRRGTNLTAKDDRSYR